MMTKSSNSIFSNLNSRLVALLLVLAIFFTPFAIVNAGERGVLMKFGEVQAPVLGEGIHWIIPIVNSVKKLSVRVQNQQISTKASSKDIQKVYTDVALNWHVVPEEANTIYQQIGDENQIIQRIINPVIEEVLKAVIARYSAEEITAKRGEIKAELDDLLTRRLANYHIEVDDISLVDVHFSDDFEEAVEAKQIAEQKVKRAEFIALEAIKDAEAKVNLAKGETEAQRLLRETLTAELLQKQAIEKWDGKFPLFVGKDGANLWDLSEFAKANR